MDFKNLTKKYSVTEEDIKTAVNQLSRSGLHSITNTQAMIAISDLLGSGDIPETTKPQNKNLIIEFSYVDPDDKKINGKLTISTANAKEICDKYNARGNYEVTTAVDDIVHHYVDGILQGGLCDITKVYTN